MSVKDTLAPPIQIIGKRHYRVNVIHEDYRGGPAFTRCHKQAYQEEDLYGEDDEETYEIEELQNSFFKTSFHVPRVFYGGLIGHKGLTKKRIESETKTEINIPGVRATAESLVSIKGKSRKDVCTARRRVELVIDEMRKKTKPTHFVNIPLCTDEIKRTFNHLKISILSEHHPGIEEDMFTTTEKIHITLAPCTLLDDDERIRAAHLFSEFKEIVKDMPPIDINVRGLDIMNDDASSVGVLYACIDSPNLQELADKVLKKFKEANLCNEDKTDHVKMHMTIMKSRSDDETDPRNFKTFDARAILKKYADYEFGKLRVTEIHLSQMHSTAENGFYVATGLLTV